MTDNAHERREQVAGLYSRAAATCGKKRLVETEVETEKEKMLHRS
jgi:hypothetical protein